MVIKNLENKIKLYMQPVLSGMCDHLSWQHLDSQGNGQ